MQRIAKPTLLSVLVLLAATSPLAAQPLLRRLEERLRAVEPQPQPLPVPGTSTFQPIAGPARLGVQVDEVTRQAILQYDLAVRRGALIVAIEAGSAADQAGLPIGGVIVAVDGIRVDSANELANMVRSTRPGQSMELTYYQGRRLYRKRLQPSPFAAAPDGGSSAVPPLPESLPPATTVRPPAPLGSAGSDLAEAFGQSDRPLLNRLGRILDGFVTPAGNDSPLAPSPGEAFTVPPVPAEVVPANPPDATELQALRRQVATLQSQVESLTARLAELEKQLPPQRD